MESGEQLPRSDPRGGRGGWRAALFIIVVSLFERIGFSGVEGNLITYLSGPLGMSTAAAAAGANAWSGTVLVLPLVGALAADSRLGRYRAVLLAGVLYLLSLGMLTVSSMLQTSQPHPRSCHGTATACSSAPSTPSPARLTFFYAALYLLAVAQGFHKPCSEAMGADQFDPTARASRSSYFNWFHFSISWGYAIAATAVTYVQENVGWTVGFAACWAIMVVYLVVFLLGTGTYRAEKPVDGSSFAQLFEKFTFSRKVVGTDTDTQRLLMGEPEEGKGFLVKLLPIWLSSLVFATAIAQITTLFTKQGSTMYRSIGGLVVPPAALQSFISITYITLVPVYDRALVPLVRRLTGHPSGITTLQRVGAGMAMSCVTMAIAALVEAKRLRVAADAGLLDRPDVTVPMSLWWLVPQYVLIGLAEVFTYIGLEEFFYDQVPDAFRSVGLALSLSIFGVGNYASSALVAAINWATTRGGGESWFSNNLNHAHLDYFYWLLSGLGVLEVVVFLYFAKRYVYRNKCQQ
ncbi:protein NRT1/ PTR FAMILY 5.10-like [Lolium rigidum]|uniref:protein NRT1/ PTR FAMILY 5.10-like n=1 Tax=Lolium rigidum TaxID=89674 RepID=UPI001F5C425F|nr:protein NRT1/ PTR FAMILY 5.10-like [Lolium rigidum]